ncbi:hypothetical protein BDZ45DRAFT_753606 [Acephala macrosclerotiorum]|nr:hypothetical protein BDZ45DRAFT_753606 [Acephala macrosclerotiorum]
MTNELLPAYLAARVAGIVLNEMHAQTQLTQDPLGELGKHHVFLKYPHHHWLTCSKKIIKHDKEENNPPPAGTKLSETIIVVDPSIGNSIASRISSDCLSLDIGSEGGYISDLHKVKASSTIRPITFDEFRAGGMLDDLKWPMFDEDMVMQKSVEENFWLEATPDPDPEVIRCITYARKILSTQ